MLLMSSPSHADLLREYLELLSQPGAESRLPGWKDWFRLRVGGAVAVGAALALTGCDDSDGGFGNSGGAAGASQTRPASGGTSSSVATGGSSSTNPASGGGGISDGTKYGVPMTTSSTTNMGTKYGVPMTTGGTPGSMVALYAVVMSGGSANPSSQATGGNSNSGLPGSTIAIYAAPMTGGNTSVVTSPGLRYGVPASTGGRSNASSASNSHGTTGGVQAGVLYGIPMES